MKTRIISAIAALILLAAVVYAGKTAIGLVVFLLAVIGIYEFFGALTKGGFRPVYPLGFISCLALLFPVLRGIGIDPAVGKESMTAENINRYRYALLTRGGAGGNGVLQAVEIALFLLIVILFCFVIFSGGKYKVRDVSATLFGIAYVVFLFSFVTLTRNLENGSLYIWMIFIGAWATDTFAFFTGLAFGKRKILPRVSPKKTVEGSVGGVVGCIAAMLAFGAYAANLTGTPLYHFAILGGVCGVISQIGDWAASAVKREAGIKDYGNIMPGHGGVLDRVDSMLFVAPAVYFYICLFF
jgi:phosphatidate cytidylyltransferase